MIIPAALGVGAYAGYQALGAGWSVYIDPLLEPAKLEQSYRVWADSPILRPTVDQLQLLLLQGRASDPEEAMRAMVSQGVYPYGASRGSVLWHDVMEARRPRPGIPDIIMAYQRGVLGWDEVCRLLRAEGALPEKWQWLMETSLTYPSILDGTLMANRGLINTDMFNALVYRAGYHSDKWHRIFGLMRQSLPGPQDVIRFAVREGFNDRQAAILGLDQEFDENPQFQELCKAVGIGPATYVNDAGEEKIVDTPKLYWRSHWQLPSPTQSYDWLRRLRPNRVDRFRSTLPPDIAKQLQPFTGEQLFALLKANDYAPQWRPYLAASSYLPLTRIDARRLYDAAFIDERELVEQYLDQGYVRDDAEKMAAWAASDRELSRRKLSAKALADEALRGYEAGWVDRNTAARAIYPTVVRNSEQLSEWLFSPIDQQTATALAHHQVSAKLNAIDTRLRTQQVNEAIRATTTRVLDGMITVVQGRYELQRLGLTPQRIDYWISRWLSRLSGSRRTLILRQLVQYQQQGVITPGELVRRARNLGYPSADLRVIMAGAERNLKLALARQAAAEERTRKAQARAHATQIKELERELEKARQNLAWKSSPQQIVKWYTAGRITRNNAVYALGLKGLKSSEIDLLLTPEE